MHCAPAEAFPYIVYIVFSGNLFLNELLFTWQVNKFEFYMTNVAKEKKKCFCPKENFLINIEPKYIITFKFRSN
jgi:hypothetical protein